MKKVLSALALMTLVVVGLLLPAPASAAVGDPWWVASEQSAFSGTTATLKGSNTSVETTSAFDGFDVVAGQASFEYKLIGDTKCTAGAPRLFVTIGGSTVNTWDHNQPGGTQCGEEVGDGWFKVGVPVAAGKVTAMGLVYDSGTAGEVQVRNVLLPTGANTHAVVSFAAVDQGVVDVTTLPEPTYTAPTCEAAGTVTFPTTLPTGVTGYFLIDSTGGKVSVGVTTATNYALSEEGFQFGPYVVAKLTGPQCEASESPSPSPSIISPAPGGDNPSQSPSATASPTGSATGTPSASSSTSVVPGAVGGGSTGGSLPVTGVKVLTVAGVGGLLVAIGGLLLVGLRRRAEGHGDNDGDTQVMPTV